MPKKKLHSTASRFLYDRYIAGDPKREQDYEEVVVNAEIARKIFELRTKAGLTQQELANMLKRIAEALDKRIEIRFLPVKRTA